MKYRFISFFISILFSICANAQIKNTILNCTLGTATKAEVKRSLSSKGLTIKNESDTDVVLGKVEFAGITWEEAHFMFVKNKLYNVVFVISDKDQDDKTLKQMRLYLDKSLYEKYAQYVKTNDQQLFFYDNKTKVSTDYFDHEGNRLVTLTYLDVSLLMDEMERGKDDL